MESGTAQRYNSLFSFFGEEEIEVSNTILNLPNLIFESESRYRFSFNWVSKRKRSSIDSRPSPTGIRSSSSPSVQRSSQCERGTERSQKVKLEVTSPSTPLSFSPSESDYKSKHSMKRSSRKRPILQTKEELLKTIDEQTRHRELLRREVEVVRSYYDKLKALNLELKAKKQELSNSCLIKEEPHLKRSKSMNSGMKMDQHCQISMVGQEQQLIVQGTAFELQSQVGGRSEYPLGQRAPLLLPSSELNKVNQTEPLGIPYPNVCAEETSSPSASSSQLQLFVLNRVLTEKYKVMAAEARKRRMIKMKEMKNSFAATKNNTMK